MNHSRPSLRPGRNIAVKMPAHEYAAALTFYRDVLGFEEIGGPAESATRSTRFRFGDKTLWIDEVHTLSQAEIWLEVITDDAEGASAYFEEHHIPRRDRIEPLGSDFPGFWIAAPGNLIHLVAEDE